MAWSPRTLICCLLVLGMLWAAAGVVLIRTSADPPFPAAETIDQLFSARPGMNLQPEELTPGQLEATLAALSQAGVTWVRFTLPWDEIEPERGKFDWTPWDAVAASLARWPDLQPIVVLDRSPAWARDESDAENPMAPPRERSDFGAFVRAVAERYGAQFTYYQVWHEPNIAPHWGRKPVDPAAYLGLLREAAIMIRAADIDARIIAAALAPTTEDGGTNLSDLTFLDQLYSLGGRAWFDFPAVQPYGFSTGPDEPPDPAELNFARAYEARQVMLRHGDAGTPLWATAFGWNAATDAETTSPWGNVTADEQTAYTSAAFAKVAEEWPWLGPMLWTGYFPPEAETREALVHAALPTSFLAPGSHRTDHPALHYGNGWRVTPSAADPSADGDAIDFIFHGTGLALSVQGGPYWAYLTASIDGKPANRLPVDETGASYLVLHDPSFARRLVPLAAALPLGDHTARLVATGGWGQWALQGVVVSTATHTPARLGWVLLALALVATALVVAVFVLESRKHRSGGPAPASRDVRTAANSLFTTVPDPGMWGAAVALVFIFLASPWILVDLASLALLGLLFMIRPTLAPPLIAASLPFWQRTQPLLSWQFGLFELLAWLGLAAWVARSSLVFLTQRAEAPRNAAIGRWWLALDITNAALCASALIATISASEQGVAWREFRIVFLFGLVFYFLITRTAGKDSRSAIRSLVIGLLAGAIIASLIGLWQGVTGQGRVDVEGVGRIAALYGSPNNLALLLDRAVPLALALALFGPWLPGESSPSDRRGHTVERIVWAAAFVITFAAAIVTFSKGALLLGLPVGLAFVLIGGAWRSGRRSPLWALVGLAVVGAAGLLLLFRTPRFAGLLDFQSGTSFLRLKLWRGSLNMALEHPFLGVGPDNFLYAYRSRYVLPSGWEELNLSHPHNILLDLWTRLGLLGVVAGAAALLVTFAAGWRIFTGRADRAVWPLALGLLAGLAAAVAHGLIDNSLFLPDLMGWFVSASGIFWLYSVQRED